MNDHLPLFLQEARAQAKHFPLNDGFQNFVKTWETFVEHACRKVPMLRYDPVSCLLVLGAASPGCIACRAGQWDCLFVTHRCNLDCPFCYSPQAADDNFCGSNLGRNPLESAALYPNLGIQAVSFTGGEALLEKERLLRWLADSHQVPGIEYRWLYSNGLLLDESTLDDLAVVGLDEIRINAAASGYIHPHVLAMMQAAARQLPFVTVEIPLLPADREHLLTALPVWVDHGVRLVNLHELLYEPGSNAATLAGERQWLRLPDGHETWIDPRCADLALAVFQVVKENEMPLSVNYCSTVGKWRQLTARREAVMQLEKPMPEELYVGDGILESYYRWYNNDLTALRPDQLQTMRNASPAARFFRLRRMAPLSPNETRKHWISFEHIGESQI